MSRQQQSKDTELNHIKRQMTVPEFRLFQPQKAEETPDTDFYRDIHETGGGIW